MRDFYRVLGVGRDADEKTIAKAYKALAKRLHPDVNRSAASSGAGDANSTASDELRDVIEAYQVLSKPDKRAAYDNSWNDGRAELRRRIVMAAVIAMAGSVTLASLAVAYLWRAELLAERGEAHPPSTIAIADTLPVPEPVEPVARSQEIAPRTARQPVRDKAADAKRKNLPIPRIAASPRANKLDLVAGPARVARPVPVQKAPKLEEMAKFEILKTAEVVFGPEPDRVAEIGTSGTTAVRANSAAGKVTPVQRPPGKIAATGEPFPLPERPPTGVTEKQDLVFTNEQAAALIAKWYLSSSGRDRRTLHTLYCPKVDFWGQRAAKRSSVIDQITEFAGRWPRRAYRLQPGSLEVSPAGRPLSFQAGFKYEFSVSGGNGFGGAAGLASGRLVMERQNGRWRICAEDGQVLKRYYPQLGTAGGIAPQYAISERMDTHRILFGE